MIIGGQAMAGVVSGGSWGRSGDGVGGRMQDISVNISSTFCPQRLLIHVHNPHGREPGKRGDETRKQCSAIKKHSERCDKEIAN